jgi:phosphoglucomutase/phosphomannomutase
MELAAGLRRERKTLLDRLDELYAAHGHFIEDQFSETCHGPSGKQQIQTLMAALRSSPPAALGGMALERMRDYAALNIVSLSDGRSVGRLPEPKTEMVFFESSPGAAEVRVAVRPSGTEPKIKFYFFVRRACPAPEDLPDVKAANRSALDAAMADLRAWIQAVIRDGNNGNG